MRERANWRILVVAAAACAAAATAAGLADAVQRPAKAAHAKAPVVRRIAAAVIVDLCAKAGNATMADGAVVPIWGFARKPAGIACTDPSVGAQLPGPVLDVSRGDVVTLNVTNALVGRTISLEAPGIDLTAGPQDAAPGNTVSLTFTASAEGTYLYDSAGDAGRQQAMGLYGALVVRGSTPGQADGAAFDLERTLVLSELDPAFNAAPDTFDMNAWKPTYWLINGQPYRSDAPTIDAHAGDRLLLRYANAGIDDNTMTMLGLRARLLARDAYALANPFDVVAETFASGATADALVTVPATAAAGTRFPLYNRQLHLTNGLPGGAGYSPGGMLTFVRVVAP
jgi:FtsP/CotA-like multicopper oxidase with cupredoxin domain